LLSPASPRSMPLFADRRTKENYKQPLLLRGAKKPKNNLQFS
jgi:hypothetical protein